MMAGEGDKSSVAAQHLAASIGHPILMSKIGMAMADVLQTQRLLLRPLAAMGQIAVFTAPEAC